MFDLSLAELVLIVVVAVVFIGPKELPVVLRAIASFVRAIKKISADVRAMCSGLVEEAGLSAEVKMIQGDDGKWYESYPSALSTTRHTAPMPPDEAGQ